MGNILGIAGSQGSGKDSACNLIFSLFLTNIQKDGAPLIDFAALDANGDITVPVEESDEVGIIKLWNRDKHNNTSESLHPDFLKKYSYISIKYKSNEPEY